MGSTKDYCYFKVIEKKPKTKVYGVYAKSDDSFLGVIAWHVPWRQYCFFPMAKTVWSRGCLQQVQDFLQKLMDERK